MRRALVIFIFILFNGMLHAQKLPESFLADLLKQKGSPHLQDVLSHPETYRYQLIYTKIDRDKNNVPHFQDYTLRLNKDEYFNPASTVKMPLAFLALEKLNEQHVKGVDKFTPMLTDSAYGGQSAVTADTTAQDGLPSIAHYIRKIFLVSDNDAYNRLYEFLGQQYINERLWKKGYKDIRITRRFVPMDEDQNRHTNPLRFKKSDGSFYIQPAATSTVKFDYSKQVLIGNAHYDRDEKLVNSPMDFTKHNNVPLQDLQQILRSVLFPASVSATQRFDLRKEDYDFLYRYMSELPSESRYPRYDTSEYFDSYTKFFLFKSGKGKIPPNIRVFNKPGWSYGFLTDVAYIVDFEHNVEFMLSGVIYVNSDGILNDDKYEYDQVGYPFFKEVGEIVYQYELQRTRSVKPDLSRFRFSYKD
jgi:Beta-lactamase enzyme family